MSMAAPEWINLRKCQDLTGGETEPMILNIQVRPQLMLAMIMMRRRKNFSVARVRIVFIVLNNLMIFRSVTLNLSLCCECEDGCEMF